jgi:hypothetical protein
MKRVKLFISLLPALIFLFILPTTVLAETTELTSVADSFVNDGYPENNYAAAHSLVVSHNSVYRWGLVRFDLDSLPDEAIIDSATLKLYLYNESGDASIPIMAAKILNGWSETQVKWSNRPMFDESTGVTINVDTTLGYKSWGVTDFIKDWFDGASPNYGIGIGYGGGNFARSFRSREYSANRPLLSITYHLPEPSPSPEESVEPSPEPEESSTPEAEEEAITSEEISPEPSPSPEESASPSPEEEKVLGIFSTGQALIALLILLALAGAVISFIGYARKPKEKKKKKPKKEEEPIEEENNEEE